MNFWTGLILGIIIGWLVEWVIDWLFWRRDAEEAHEAERLLEQRAVEAEANAAEWDSRLSSAEEEYQTRLRAVEEDWQARLNLNEQQWQTQFRTLEGDNADLRSRMADTMAGATLGAAGALALDEARADDVLDEELILQSDDTRQADPLSVASEPLTPPHGAVVAAAVLSSAGEGSRRDDLTRVHGIGRKYARFLNDAGIISYEDLAAASPEQLRDIIKPSPLQRIDFDSWKAQAAALAGVRGATASDDLTRLEGIGPVYAAKLGDQGIDSFDALAAADETKLAAIIAAPAWRRVNYGDWIAQARLAAAGDEAGLAELQAGLFRRGGDNLELIHGMGGRSAAALQSAGITTFAALAAATPQEVESALRDAGVRGSSDYEAWISEAGVRASGKRVSTGRPRPTHIVPCPQDLSAVAGVGPVFEERLYAAGIGSYWGLAETPTAELATILGPHQGVDLEGIKAAAMRRAAETNSLGRAWDGSPPDDFDGLPGIGEVYERRLYEAGICTYETMAATSPERLAEICKAPRMRTPDYAAWVATAADLAAAKRGG